METIEALAGTLPDGQVADRLGMDVEAVKAWRREHGVAPFRRPPPPRAKAAAAAKRPQVVRRRNGGDVEPVAWREEEAVELEAAGPTEVIEVAPPAPARRGGRRPTAEARLAPFRERLGREPDDVIAREAGLSRGVVGAYRRTHGIPAYEGYLFQAGRENAPRASAAEAPEGGSRIEAFAHLLGVESDAAVAAKAGVSRTAVTAFRKRRGIGAMQPKRAARPEPRPAAPAPAPTPERAPVAAPARPARVEGLRAYVILATARGAQREFYAVGPDATEAARRAEAALAARADGPWLVDALRQVGDAVG